MALNYHKFSQLDPSAEARIYFYNDSDAPLGQDYDRLEDTLEEMGVDLPYKQSLAQNFHMVKAKPEIAEDAKKAIRQFGYWIFLSTDDLKHSQDTPTHSDRA